MAGSAAGSVRSSRQLYWTEGTEQWRRGGGDLWGQAVIPHDRVFHLVFNTIYYSETHSDVCESPSSRSTAPVQGGKCLF